MPRRRVFRWLVSTFLVSLTVLGCLDRARACVGFVEISYGFENASSQIGNCCVTDGSRVLRCGSLDDALALLVNQTTATTVQVDLNADSFTLNSTFHVNNVENLTIRGIEGRASILCTGESSGLLVTGAEYFTLENIQVSNCNSSQETAAVGLSELWHCVCAQLLLHW